MTQREIIGKGKYAVGPHQQFVDRSGQLVRIVRGESTPIPVGQAYGLFDCNAEREQVQSLISEIDRAGQVSPDLELELFDPPAGIMTAIRLLEAPQSTSYNNLRYLVDATLPRATDRQTADELAKILNQDHLSALYKKGEKFEAKILYKENGRWTLRD